MTKRKPSLSLVPSEAEIAARRMKCLLDRGMRIVPPIANKGAPPARGKAISPETFRKVLMLHCAEATRGGSAL